MNFFGKIFGARALSLLTVFSFISTAFFLSPTSTNAVGRSKFFGGRTMSVISTTGQAGTQVTVSIELDSQGDEVAASFSLNYDPAIFSNPVVALGSGTPQGSVVSVNTNQAASGRVGVLVDSTNPFIVSPPNRQVITLTLTISPTAPTGASPITFVTSPTFPSVSSALGALLPTVYQVGTVTVTPPAVSFVTIGGRVTTPSGQNLRNVVVSLIDSDNVRRTAVTSSFGIYSFTNVATNQTYTLTAFSKRYRFSPRIETITASASNLDFAGLE